MKTAVLLSVGLGLLAGYLYGDELRHRKHAEEYAHDLTKLLDKASLKTPLPDAQLKKMAAVLNDAHRQITTVSKAHKKPPPKPQNEGPDLHDPAVPKVWVVKHRCASKHQPIGTVLEPK